MSNNESLPLKLHSREAVRTVQPLTFKACSTVTQCSPAKQTL